MGPRVGGDDVWETQTRARLPAARFARVPESARRTADWTFPWVCGGCIEPTFKDW
jgi:urea transport system substrate-binding protein